MPSSPPTGTAAPAQLHHRSPPRWAVWSLATLVGSAVPPTFRLRGALSGLLPGNCQACGSWSPGPLCPACLARFAMAQPRCSRCALALPQEGVCGTCLREAPPFDRTVAAVDYGFPWDGLITRFKFHAQPELAVALAPVLADAVARTGPVTAACVLPVPSGPARLSERGYNPAWELARRLARSLGLPADATLLHRLGDTAHQVGLTRAQRQANLRDAFWVPPEARRHVQGRAVALVDDVMTTGVTAAAAGRALLAAGATEVQVWVLARTPPPAD